MCTCACMQFAQANLKHDMGGMAASKAVVVWFLVTLSPGWCQVKSDCPALPPLARPARNVYELRPQDIKVVMALGDSITAGFGMIGNGTNIIKDFTEYRGQSWNMGMDEGAQTVPNFLRRYNPHLVGGSLGQHLLENCYGSVCPPYQYRPEQDVFNAAQSGAMVTNLMPHELDYLLKELHKHGEVDMENDWKLLTLFIGTNDICKGCSGNNTVQDYDKHLREVLEEVRQQIPKLFVNLILIGNLSDIYRLSLKSQYCSYVHRYVPIECHCAFASGGNGNQSRLAMDNMSVSINRVMKKIAEDYAKKRYPDFAVVVQPFLSNTVIDVFPVSYLSSFDCFHPSLLAHQAMARGLWNNMITPAAEKNSSFTLHNSIKCPTNTTLLYTN